MRIKSRCGLLEANDTNVLQLGSRLIFVSAQQLRSGENASKCALGRLRSLLKGLVNPKGIQSRDKMSCVPALESLIMYRCPNVSS